MKSIFEKDLTSLTEGSSDDSFKSPKISHGLEKNPFDFNALDSYEIENFLTGTFARNEKDNQSYSKNNFLPELTIPIESPDENNSFVNERSQHLDLNNKGGCVSEIGDIEDSENMKLFMMLLNDENNSYKFAHYMKNLLKQPIPVEFAELKPTRFREILLKILRKTVYSEVGLIGFIDWLFHHQESLEMYSALTECYSTLEQLEEHQDKNIRFTVKCKKQAVLDFLLTIDEGKTKKLFPNAFLNTPFTDFEHLLQETPCSKKIGPLWREKGSIIIDEALTLPIHKFRDFAFNLFRYSLYNHRVVKFFWDQVIDKKCHPISTYVEIINEILKEARPKLTEISGAAEYDYKRKITDLEMLLSTKLHINEHGKRFFESNTGEQKKDWKKNIPSKKLHQNPMKY